MPKLTVGAVNKYKPQKARREIWDTTPGLVLIIQPSGTKTWALRVRRPSGKLAKLTLGRYVEEAYSDAEPTPGAPLTLVQARQLANKFAHERALGRDIVAENAARKARQRTEQQDLAANTFTLAAREFFAEHKTRKWKTRPRRWRGDARLLGLDWPKGADPATVEPTIVKGSLADTWRDRPLATIDAADCATVIDESKKRGIPGLKARNQHASDARGRKMHAALSTLFTWAVQRRKAASNPTIGLWHPGPPPARDRVLTDADIKVFWLATDKIPVPFGAVLKLLLLTGCRANEVNGMRWSELGADGVWIIPGVRTKNHRPHAVPLSPLAQSIISQVPRLESDFVFTTTGTSPISGWSKIKHALDEKMKVEPWRVHDLRRTAASGMQRLGIRTEVIERVLNHVSGSFGGVTGIYQRDPLSEEVKTALLRWSQHIAGLAAADNKGKVVKLPRNKRA